VPLYEYQCLKCGRKTEKIEKVAGPHLKKCPHCGGKVEQLLAAPAIQFKGSGWYVTDYAGKNSSSASDGGTEKSAAGDKEGKGAKDTSTKEAKDTAVKESSSSADKKASKKK
jgi:putative FmdB family regulatory protein